MKIALLLLLVFTAVALIAASSDAPSLEAAIDKEVSKAMKGGLFPSIVVGVYKDGRKYFKAYGTVPEGTPSLTGNSVYQIGSLSKLLTASLLQKLCDRGTVSMESTLGELLGGAMPLAPSVKSVTLRQLVTHTSGFPSIPKPLGEKATQMAGDQDLSVDPYRHLRPEFVFAYLATADGKREPGKFEYSNFGMGLLAHVLERATGKDYESLVKEEVLAPLGMTRTQITLSPEMQAHLIPGFSAKGKPAPLWTFGALAGAGAFSSTVEDMLTFIQANVEEKGAAAPLFRSMRVPQFSGDTGIGWLQPSFLDRTFGNKTIVWHNGMVGAYASYLSIDETTKTGVIILTNRASTLDMLGMMLTRQVRTRSWSEKGARPQDATKSHPET